MRMGVLDIGSNTGHLLVVDAYRGGPPLPAHSFREPLRLAEHLDAANCVNAEGLAKLLDFIKRALVEAERLGCAKIMAFATSAVRDADNCNDVLDRVNHETGVDLSVLPGEDEARLTFLAGRRWFGWSSGRLGVFDIGGGSLEIAVGSDESPTASLSLPLGAGRLTREWINAGKSTADLRAFVRQELAANAGRILREGAFDHAVATSKTFRSLARICGAAPSQDGPYVRRILARDDALGLVERLEGLSTDDIAALPGVSTDRAYQMLAGAVLAEAVVDLFDLEALELCPWALREGVLLEELGHL